VNNTEYNEYNSLMMPQSTEQIIKVEGLRDHDLESSDDEDDDGENSDHLYQEFDSSDSG
jgi:hypothetical protein